MQDLKKLPKRLLRQTAGVVQRLDSTPCSLSKLSHSCQNYIHPVGVLCSSFPKERRTQPDLVSQRHRSPDAGPLLALHGKLFGGMIRSANPNEFPQKLDFFDDKEQFYFVLFRYKSKAKDRNQKRLARPKAHVLKTDGSVLFCVNAAETAKQPGYRLGLYPSELL